MTKYNGKCLDCHKEGRRYYWKNHQKIQQAYRDNPRLHMFRGARNRAREFNREFDITEEDIMIPERCPISGKLMVPCSPDAPSLDRIDNSKGYTRDNIGVISKRINAAKSALTLEEVEALARYMRAAELLS